MNRIDGLGPRPDRHAAFTRELLSEAEDDELKFIVEEAAKDLKTPIALVSLVMEQIQFFKAHYGMPEQLIKLRGTDRDLSFCQFVVHSEEPFEVVDAKNDSRVPQTLVDEYNIQAYLGMPIVANDIVVGSLCVIDTKPRRFSSHQRESLRKLANLVNIRLAALTNQKSHGTALLEKTAYPALEEMRKVFQPMKSALSAGHMATVEIATFLRVAEHGLHGRGSYEDKKIALSRAKDALENCQNNLYNIEASLEDAEDSLGALAHVFNPATTTLLSEIAISGRELARYNLAKSGGAFLPDLQDDPLISVSRPLGVSLVATSLSMMSNELLKNGLREKLRMNSEIRGSHVLLTIQSEELNQNQLNDIALEQKKYTGEVPSVDLKVSEHMISLLFSIVQIRN